MFDLHGNLFEWSHDLSGNFDVEAITDPQGAESGDYRLLRGGAWSSVAANCRAAVRFTFDPTSRSDVYGFRLALSLSGGSDPAEQRLEQRLEQR